MKSLFNVVAVCLAACVCHNMNAQDPARFADEVKALSENEIEHDGSLVLFTGSSSIRMWTDLAEAFPQYIVANHGFGGSQTSDLIYFMDDLIVKHNPRFVVIYEGDNDLAAQESPGSVLTECMHLLQALHAELPDAHIVFISAKPSIARWDLLSEYLLFNKTLAGQMVNFDYAHFVNVWDPMLNPDGTVREDLFIEDGLHMNAEGYEIWKDAITPVLESLDN